MQINLNLRDLRPITTTVFSIATLFCISAVAPAQADEAPPQNLTVTVNPSTVDYEYYDPDAKPEKVPIGMKGLTEPQWKFSCRINWLHYDSPGSIRFQVKNATCEISLPIVITLPKDANPKLKAHEDGHLKINQYFYNEYANAAINSAAKSVIGKEYTIEAPDYDEAKKQIVQVVVKEVAKEYRRKTSVIAEKANVLYDSLTDHGRKNDVESISAAMSAIKQVEQSESLSTASVGSN